MKRHLSLWILLVVWLAVGHAAALTCGATGESHQVPATYISTDGNRMKACFDNERNRVTLETSDGSVFTLPSAVSASGTRYSDGLHTFWEHQGVGRYFVSDVLRFQGNIEKTEAYSSAISATCIQKTQATAAGMPIRYPVTDKAEVTVMLVEIPPGQQTGWHKHPTPVYAYVLAGELEVEPEPPGHSSFYRAGDAIIEMVDVFHNGRNKGDQPCRLVVFYTGIQGQELVIRK
ncbi:MAG: cupin domain-containing protein [Thermodesulfobacteriota bacterium]